MFSSLLTNNDHPKYSKKYTYIPNVNGQQINLIWPKKINFIIFYRFLFIFRRRKKRSQKMKFYEAYKVTMYSMANELKCLMWGIKWKAIKFCANCIEYRTFHQSFRFSSDLPMNCQMGMGFQGSIVLVDQYWVPIISSIVL